MFNYNIGDTKNIDLSSFTRKAARAIIIKDKKVLVLKSDNKEVKLPGGGLEANESFYEALVREVKEETGYKVLSAKEVGSINTFALSKQSKGEIFKMQSKYFLVEVNDLRENTNFQGYEITENFRPVFMDINEMISINESAFMLDKLNDIALRELMAFKEIKKMLMI